MDKWKRIETGYKTDNPDGIYEVVDIAIIERPIEEQKKNSHLIEIRGGVVNTSGCTFSQSDYFMTNEIIDFMPFD